MSPSVPHDTLAVVWSRCREQCARMAPAVRLLDQLATPSLNADREGADAELASAWGRAMATQAPSEEELLWLGGLWLATVHQLYGADSEVAEALGRWFAVVAEVAANALSGEPGG